MFSSILTQIASLFANFPIFGTIIQQIFGQIITILQGYGL